MQASFKHRLEYRLMRYAIAVVEKLPLRVVLGLGWFLCRFYFAISGRRTAKAIDRLKQVFGNSLAAGTIRRVAWLSMRNNCFTLLELLRIRSTTLEQLKKQPLFSLAHRAQVFYHQHGPFVLAVPHMGNWEMGAAVMALSGLPCIVIAKRQKNLLVDTLLNELRCNSGLEVVYSDARGLKRVLQAMRQGKVLLVLPDSYSRTESIKVNFLGGKANLGAGSAHIARKIGCPIIPFILLRHGWACHDNTLCEPIWPDSRQERKADLQRMMQELMNVFDRAIRKHPEQYLWYNKRWLLDPPWNTSNTAARKARKNTQKDTPDA
jgi:Kdo2-lipid IVA lauroyltransferase/acyltransferase